MFWISQHQAAVALLLSVVALAWQTAQFAITHNSDARNRQFEAYHRLIKELVKPEDGCTYVDRQCAAVFELVRFKRYRPVTSRILAGLREDWRNDRSFHPRLAAELDIALDALGVRHTKSLS